MIVTRSWLEEYIDLSDISDEALYKRFNEIGLEVDSYKKYEIPAKVVVGEVISCQKHPDADKLNVCQVNIGNEVVQIVCGASNVVNARYVAVATVGSILPGDFKIKKAKLRGVESLGMICSSTELGLPELEDGIMILDDSIGELKVGEELNNYKRVADSVFELELTANRGDCQSIHGVARDLSAAFKKDLASFDFEPKRRTPIGVAKELSVVADDIPARLIYSICNIKELNINFLQRLRLAFVEIDVKDNIDMVLRYAMHESGVLNRAYDFDKLAVDGKVSLEIKKDNNIVEVVSNKRIVSIVGVNQNDEFRANKESKKVLLESSYIEPEFVIEGVSSNKLESDDLYYFSSRGSEPNVIYGVGVLQRTICVDGDVELSSGDVKVGEKIQPRKMALNIKEVIDIIGFNIPKSEIANILLLLGYRMNKVDEDTFSIEIPPHAHDIKNTQDIAEEILRIYGIDNIEAKHSIIVEQNRITQTYKQYKDLRDLRERAIGVGFYEALTYAFANKELLEKYGFEVLDESLELINPIVKELNTLRSTILVNLLEAASRNVKYGKKSIKLFEAGVVFNSKREELQKIAFIYSGEEQRASVVNSAKAKMVDIDSFTKSLGGVIGDFELIECEAKNALMHPYISAKIIKDGNEVGYLAKLHPGVEKDFSLSDTFIAELDLEAVMPKHINAKELSNYQAVNKDLSVVVDKDLNFYNIAKAMQEFKENQALLKDFYPLDIYSDEALGDKKSLTIRFTIQSDTNTLSDKEIESVMSEILELLKSKFGAELR